MSLKLVKPAAIAAVCSVLIGYFLFGTSFLSYLRTTGKVVQRAAQDSVSVEFELQRARDMVDDILPQLQANVRLIAEDEVEIAALEKDIAAGREKLLQQQSELADMRKRLQVQQVSYRVGGRELSRDHMTQQLSRRFDRYRESELILQSKEKLLDTRRQSLANAIQMQERAKHQKVQLEQRIEALVAQHRLVQTSSIGSRVAVDGSQMNRAEQLLAQIQRRLDISQRVLAHESDLHEIQLSEDQVDEAGLLAEYDAYFGEGAEKSLVAKH